MGKQSARLYYQKKDHKDILFNGRYHQAMCFNSEVVWRKLRDSDYYLLQTRTFNSSAQNWTYYECVVYPSKKYVFPSSKVYFMSLTHNNRMVFGNIVHTSYIYKSNKIIYSTDGKMYHINTLSNYINHAIPIKDGFFYVGYESYSGSNETGLFCVRYDQDDFEEIKLRDTGGISYFGSAYIGGECPDGVVVNIPNTNAYSIMTSDGSISPGHEHAIGAVYGNGLYASIYSASPYFNAAVIKANSSWRGYKTPIPYGASMLSILYRGGKFIIYYYYGKLMILETEDFRAYRQITVSAKKLILEYAGHAGSYIDLILNESENAEDSHRVWYIKNSRFSNPPFYRNGRKMDSPGIIFYEVGYELAGRINTGFYIDNLYFEESENNFAFYASENVGDINEVL